MLRKRGHRDEVSESDSDASSGDSDLEHRARRRGDDGRWVLCAILTALACLVGGLGWWGLARVSRAMEHQRMEAPEAKAQAAAAYMGELERINCNSAAEEHGEEPACLAIDAFGGKRNLMALLVAEASAIHAASDRAGQAGKIGLAQLRRAAPVSQGETLPSGLKQEEGAWPLCLARPVQSGQSGRGWSMLPRLSQTGDRGGMATAPSPTPRAAGANASSPVRRCFPLGGTSGPSTDPHRTAMAWSNGLSAGVLNAPFSPTMAGAAGSVPVAWPARPWVWPTLWRTGGWMDHEDAWGDAVATGRPPAGDETAGATLRQRSKALSDRIRRGAEGVRAPVGDEAPGATGTTHRLPVRAAMKAMAEDERRWAEGLAGAAERVEAQEAAGAGAAESAASTAMLWVGGALSAAERQAEAASSRLMGLQDPSAVQDALRRLDLARAGGFGTAGPSEAEEAAPAAAPPCQVLSIGVERDWSFEIAMTAVGCRVVALDPSIDRRHAAAFGRAAGIRFLPWAVGGKDSPERRFGAQAKAVDGAIAVALGAVPEASEGPEDAQGGLTVGEGGAAAEAARVNFRRLASAAERDASGKDGSSSTTATAGDEREASGKDGSSSTKATASERAAEAALDSVRRESRATGPGGSGIWRHRSLSSLLRDSEATGFPPGSAVDVVKIDSEGAEWDALEDCLSAGRECWGRIGQLTVELHNVPDDGQLRGGARASGLRMGRRAEVLRRLREEAGFLGVRYHVNPMGPPVAIGAPVGSMVSSSMPCCGEALWVRHEDQAPPVAHGLE